MCHLGEPNFGTIYRAFPRGYQTSRFSSLRKAAGTRLYGSVHVATLATALDRHPSPDTFLFPSRAAGTECPFASIRVPARLSRNDRRIPATFGCSPSD